MLALALLAAIQTVECDDRNGDLAASQCWDEAFRHADAELNKVWPDILKTTQEADRAFAPSPRKDEASATKDLLASERAWVRFRDAQCRVEGDWAQGGSLQNVITGRCMAVMTRRRINQLQEIQKDFQEK